MISSLNNNLIKKAVKLRTKNTSRKELGLFFVDGRREVLAALDSGWIPETIFFSESLAKTPLKLTNLTLVSEAVFRKISFKENPDGVAAIFKRRNLRLEDLKLSKRALVVVLEAVEKPGNLGAIIRSAYAAQAELVIINDLKTDFYNPNVIRSSEGLIFKLPIIIAPFKETVEFLKRQQINIYVSALKEAKVYTSLDYTSKTAFVLGSEAFGLSSAWLNSEAEVVKIPMRSGVDSLNVSVAAAVLLFEAQRQRGFI
ncbi:MAG: RNA methyltransferase [Patescibacteria group bacterium]|jgi:TrmH family RNA methyltransferase|nr:RNA methyltransferase [Patescibacteria group bacterium]MDD3435132.1 RNA methyltransferase [Patescibacteria group bacterium]MDD4466412.1 RNA methyltransferase [Patescibacteria group bacterium]